MFYFKLSSVFFSVATLATIFGIAYLNINSGLYPQMLIFDHDTKEWYPCFEKPIIGSDPQPIEHFHVLFISTFIMLFVYVAPMIIRPLDFLKFFKEYIIGFITYFLMMPVFITCMTVYSMCNLHDISWGNRPSVQDSSQLSIHAKKQAIMLDNYKMFRVNAFCLWALANIIFILVVEYILENGSSTLAQNSGELGTL
jgi:hypothetical protein